MDSMWEFLSSNWQPSRPTCSSSSSWETVCSSSAPSLASREMGSCSNLANSDKLKTGPSSDSERLMSPKAIPTSGPPESCTGPFSVTQDMSGFDPKELVVKLVGEKVVLTGKKASQAPDGPFRYELFRREWDVPDSVDRELLTCSVSGEGQLRIEAPSLTSAPAVRTVPIQLNQAEHGARAESATEAAEHSRAKA